MYYLKTILGILLLSLAIYSPISAQTRGINYQAVARDAGNNLMVNQSLAVKFYVREATDNGAVAYQESHNATTNEYGLFNLVIGEGTAIVGTFEGIVWSSERHFLEVEVDGQSLGVQEMMSVPYSQVATSMSIEDLVDVEAGTASIDDVLQWDGTEWRSATLNIPDAVWTESTNNAEYEGDARIGGGAANSDATSEHLAIRTQSDNWYVGGLNEGTAGASDFFVGKSTVPDGTFHIENNGNVGIGTDDPSARLTVDGAIRGVDNGNTRFQLSSGTNVGTASFRGPNSINSWITHLSGNTDRGFIYATNESGAERASIFTGASGPGVVRTRGVNNSFNFVVTNHSSSNNHGYAYVSDASGNVEAGMYVNGSSQGVLFADQKNFRIPHPEQEGKEIWYCSLEGPEAAAYARGTGKVINGKATVSFPDHFSLVANPTTLTIILTPLSGQSKGLAVVQKMADGFNVEELFAGQGNYEFDWEVKGVRQGHENYRVIRDASEMIDASREDRAAGQE